MNDDTSPMATGSFAGAQPKRKKRELHGKSYSREWNSWCMMKRRTTDPLCRQWKWYGGRGITCCDRWIDSFATFLSDMGPRPPGTTLDRKDNDGPYEPGNCRWSTSEEQARHTRHNRWITYKGRCLILKDWASITGLKYHTLKRRINCGWTPEEAIETPARAWAQ